MWEGTFYSRPLARSLSKIRPAGSAPDERLMAFFCDRTMRAIDISSHASAVAATLLIVVIICISVDCDAFVLPGDRVVPPGAARQRHHRRQGQKASAGDGGQTELELAVAVRPEYAVMVRGKPVQFNCTATTPTKSNERLHLAFFVSTCT